VGTPGSLAKHPGEAGRVLWGVWGEMTEVFLYCELDALSRYQSLLYHPSFIPAFLPGPFAPLRPLASLRMIS
jgi:hypothetical protein